MKNYLKPIISAITLATCISTGAMPARPGVVLSTQPDGSRVAITIHGDEYNHRVATPDGYTLLPDEAGFWTVATLSGDRLVSSGLRYTGGESLSAARARGIRKGLLPRVAANSPRKANGATQIEGTFPAKGKHKLLMVLINYADTKTTFTQQDFTNLMNARGFNGTGSFRDYYLENSYGALDITTTVTRWVTLPSPKSSYGADGAENMIIEALTLLDDEIDLREFDNDGDGMLDGLSVVHQGGGQEATGAPNDIWSHSGTIYGYSFDGIRLGRYTIVPEKLDERITTIGVTCHEFGHNLGAPDFYDSNYAMDGEFPGTGLWDLMAGGAWNGEIGGNRPAGTNMWQKIQLGWVTPEVLTADRSVKGMKGATFEPVAYRFDTTVPGEYFILENRQQEGSFDVALPYHGLIIYHADEQKIAATIDANTLNAAYPQAMYTVCAGAAADPGPDPATYGWVNSKAAPFPGSSLRTSFTDTTLPSTKSVSGRYSYKGLVNIAESADGTIDFDFLCYDMPLAPVDLTATVSRGNVTLDWKAPAGEKPVRYNIYRNGEALASVEQPGYFDTSVASLSDIKYDVDAEYASGLISPYTSAKVRIPANIITGLTATNESRDVTLRWDLDTRLTRMTEVSDNFLNADYNASSVEIAHRFRAEDLSVYRGYKIRKMAFFPMQSQRDLKCTLTVYEIDPVTGARTVASQRALNEFGTMNWNNIVLTKAVEITGDKEIWIAVKFESSNGSVQLLTDHGPALAGYGNLVSIDGGEWKADTGISGNYFLYATLSDPGVYEMTSAPEITPAEDFLADTALPLGFTVYRDGEPVGTCGGREFKDTDVADGHHEYAVTSLFKGENESGSRTVAVDIITDGLAGTSAVASASVTGTAGRIDISGAEDPVAVTDITGRTVAALTVRGSASVELPAGVYLVTVGGVTFKVAVR